MKGVVERSHFTVRARKGKLADPNEVIFPIFRTDNDGLLHFLATGFFVTCIGWFVTAKHVVEDIVQGGGAVQGGLSIIQFDEQKQFYVRPVIGATCHEVADVAIGVCAPMSHKETGEPLFNKVLRIGPKQLLPGAPVWTYAYPGTTVVHTTNQNVEIAPKFYAGAVTEYYATGRDRTMLPAPCYRTSMFLHAASSGGPVFGPGSAVVGVNSTGVSGEEDISFISRIVDILHLGVPNTVFPGEEAPRKVTIKELVDINYVAIDT